MALEYISSGSSSSLEAGMPRMLAHNRQNFWPASPLEVQTILCAAPSHSIMDHVKWILKSPDGLFNWNPQIVSTRGESKMDWRMMFIIWEIPPSSVDTNVDLCVHKVNHAASLDMSVWKVIWEIAQRLGTGLGLDLLCHPWKQLAFWQQWKQLALWPPWL